MLGGVVADDGASAVIDPTPRRTTMMSNLERQHPRRRRARNAVAMSVIWAGLAGGAVVGDRSAAAAPAPQVTDDITTGSRTPADLAQAGMLTAAPVPIHGTADNGGELIGTFQLRRFQAQR